MAAQNYKNHVRRDYAFYALQILNLTLLIVTTMHLAHYRNALHLILAGLALSTLSAAAATRHYALKNQNRIIRLEENVRLHAMGVNPSGLTMGQMIALRFAGDAESPALAARAAAEKLSPKQIKEAIVNWRADVDRI